MKRILASLAWLLTAMMLFAAPTTGGRKVSLWLQEAVKAQKTKLSSCHAIQRAADVQEQLALVFIQLASDITDEQLAAYQARRYAQLDDIAIVMLPLSQIEALAGQSEVLRIEANEAGRAMMDTVPKLVDILPAYAATAQHVAYTGKDVVVGVMDIGFDLTHPDFYDNTSLNALRISRFWDQLSAQPGSDALPVGSEYTTPADILSKGCSSDSPTQYHGSLTLGIAAGSGYTTGYRGVAYESDICLVSNAVTSDTLYIADDDYYKFSSATDALGFKYIFDYAERQGKPCVISFSEGYSPYIDEHDSLYAAFIGKLTGPGRILVASAGNENVARTYVQKPVGVKEAGAFISTSRKNAFYRFKSDDNAEIRLYVYDKPSGEYLYVREFQTSSTDAGDDGQADTLEVNGYKCALSLNSYPSSANAAETVSFLQLSADIELNRFAELALVVAGEQSFAEIYGSSSHSLSNKDIDARWNAAEYGRNIMAPGCFADVICVGATTHRMGYTTADGKYVRGYNVMPGLLSYYSSTGPAINGLMKPDVTAPGTNVCTAHNSFYQEAHPSSTSTNVAYTDANGRRYPWKVDTGTSMSTPVVAGIIALWLQANPSLTRQDILDIMSRTCRQPDASLSYPNDKYGFGEIDAYRGLLDILGFTGIASISQHQPQGVHVAVSGGRLRLRFSEQPSAPVTVSIYSADGVLDYQTLLSPCQEEIEMPLPRLASGIYAVQLTSSDAGATGSLLVRL